MSVQLLLYCEAQHKKRETVFGRIVDSDIINYKKTLCNVSYTVSDNEKPVFTMYTPPGSPLHDY